MITITYLLTVILDKIQKTLTPIGHCRLNATYSNVTGNYTLTIETPTRIAHLGVINMNADPIAHSIIKYYSNELDYPKTYNLANPNSITQFTQDLETEKTRRQINN